MTISPKKISEIMNRFLVVVDGDMNDLVYTSILLQRCQYLVCTAKTAAEALEMTSVAPPVLIITAQHLPDTSGYDLFLKLRLDPQTSEVPVIVLTNIGDLATIQQFRDAGVTACLDKPVQVEELYTAVQSAIESRPRKKLRVDTVLPVSVNGVRLNKDAGECVIDISEEGMYIRTLKPAPSKTRLTVTIIIKKRIVSLEAVVHYSYGQQQGLFKEPGMGLEFVRISDDNREIIKQFIREEITRGVAPTSLGQAALPDVFGSDTV